MRQALHIFKKDVRYLRWEIGISPLLMTTFVYTQLHRSLLRDGNSAIMSYLMLAFWAFLSARVIQAEPIPGDRQFWITRPYEWRSLLGAKLLFLVAIIGIPLMVADAVILGVEGFSVASYSLALMWALILITASTLVAFLAFATLTRGLTEWMLAAIAIVGVDYLISVFANAKPGAGVEWIWEYSYAAITSVAAIAILPRQYKRRGAAVSIAVMTAGVMGSSLFVNYAPSVWALELETRFSKPKVDPSAVQIVARSVPHAEKPRPLNRQQVVLLAIPIDISGLGDGLDVISDDVRFTVIDGSGQLWSRKGHASDSNYLQNVPGGYRLLLRTDRWDFDRASGRPVNIQVTLYLTTLRDAASRVVAVGAGAVDVPGAGRCRDNAYESNTWIVCETPLRTPPNVLTVGFKDERRDRFLSGTSYSPFAADVNSSLNPLDWSSHLGPRDATSATLTSLEPVAHFRRDLELANVYLSDYQLPSPF
jgi:hypothetical protein